MLSTYLVDYHYLKGLFTQKLKFCHHLLTLMFFQTHKSLVNLRLSLHKLKHTIESPGNQNSEDPNRSQKSWKINCNPSLVKRYDRFI